MITPNTKNQLGSDETYTSDISGLFTALQPIPLLGNVVRYRKPGLTKVGFVVNFFRDALAPYLFSQEELQKLSLPSQFQACREALNEAMAKGEDEYNEIVSRLLLSREFYDTFFPLLRSCFPDIEPMEATDDCIIQMMSIVMDDSFGEIQEMLIP